MAKDFPLEDFNLVRQYLGGPEIIGALQSEADVISNIRKGFPAACFQYLVDRANLREATIYGYLPIAARTLAPRKVAGARFKPMESELLWRLARVLAAAEAVLGNRDKAVTWLTMENRALGGEKPITQLDTGIGFQEVLDVLNRLELGVYS